MVHVVVVVLVVLAAATGTRRRLPPKIFNAGVHSVQQKQQSERRRLHNISETAELLTPTVGLYTAGQVETG